MTRPTVLERAFQLARSGECASIGDLRQRMKAEGFAMTQLAGPSLIRQLRGLCVAASQSADPLPSS